MPRFGGAGGIHGEGEVIDMTTIKWSGPMVAVRVAVSWVLGCGDDGDAEPVIDPGDGGDYAVDIDPTGFVEDIDNPHLPLLPGTRWVYEGVGERETERVEVEVTDERRDVMGSRRWSCAMSCTKTMNWSRKRTTGSPRTPPATCGTWVRTRASSRMGNLRARTARGRPASTVPFPGS
jgi:hypothetical protein